MGVHRSDGQSCASFYSGGERRIWALNILMETVGPKSTKEINCLSKHKRFFLNGFHMCMNITVGVSKLSVYVCVLMKIRAFKEIK